MRIHLATDVTSDEKLSKAELSRAIRMIALVESQANEKPSNLTQEEYLHVSSVGFTAIAPFFAQNVIDSFDYNADGKLSIDELLTDYSPEQMEGLIDEMVNNFSADIFTKLMSMLPSIF